MIDSIRKAADNNDRERIKFIFADALDVDPTFEKYLEDFEYCKDKGLFDKHVELTKFKKSDWDEDYWFALKGDFQKNPSVERLNHMREVAKSVFADKVKRLISERSQIDKEPAPQMVPSATPDKDAALKENFAQNNAPVKEELSPSEKQAIALEKAKRDLAEQNKKDAEERARLQSSYRSTADYGREAPKKAQGMNLPIIIAIGAAIGIILWIILR